MVVISSGCEPGTERDARFADMISIPDKNRQIILAHAGLIRGVVMACHNRDHKPGLETALKAAAANGWTALVGAIRRILAGERDTRVLTGLDEEDQVIAAAILRGLQDPGSLPEPDVGPDPGLAAPGLAAMIQAAASGDVAALSVLGDMAEQMLGAGGDMARLSAILRRMVNGERDPEVLSRGMSTRGSQLVLLLLEELSRLQQH
jgi:hypothetical protein